MSRIFIFLICMLGFGCATTGERSISDVAKPSVEKVIGTKPSVGETATANVGQTIVQDFNYNAYKLADYFHVDETVDVSVAPMMSVKATPSTKLFRVSDVKFCIDNYGKDCLYDLDGDGKFEKASSMPGLIVFEKALPKVVGYTAAVGEVVLADAGGYKRELIYQGRDGSTLRVRYMEFTDNLARPAFTQDLTYPIDEGNSSRIVFRNTVVDVSRVDDTSIAYTVVDGRF